MDVGFRILELQRNSIQRSNLRINSLIRSYTFFKFSIIEESQGEIIRSLFIQIPRTFRARSLVHRFPLEKLSYSLFTRIEIGPRRNGIACSLGHLARLN